jgi:penicillin G amidase
MKALRLIASALILSILLYVFNRSLPMGSASIPPLGKFLDPFHGFWQNSFEPKHTALKVDGLTGEVSVYTDSLGIPHLFATNENDLYLAQGYITARDRLWQMEFQTHAGAGRISEILGEGPNGALLDFDKSQRRIGMVYAANNFMKALEADSKMLSLISSYSQGINQYISTLEYGSLPLEYKLLNYKPEPWTNLKVALLLKNMAKTLNIGDKDIEMTNALKLLGKEKLDILFPDWEGAGDPIVDKKGKWDFKPVKLDSIPMAVPKDYVSINQVVEKPDEGIGSNNWAVNGTKTATGAPILCGDPHLTLSQPSIWYAIHLNCPEVNVMGVSLPGAPGVVIGFNDSIAWSVTNAQRDVVDWYTIQFKDASRNEYLSDGKWLKINKIIEQYQVKGKGIVYDTVLYSHHGPIAYDRNFHSDNRASNMAFRWISHEPSNEAKAIYQLNKGRNHQDYMNALNYYAAPAQNWVFASVDGDIAMRIQGKYPVRRKNEGRFVLDGTKTYTEWQTFIPNEQNVMDKNPERGFVSSANQYPADETYPYYVTGTSFEAYRNRRINQRLAEMNTITPQDMMALQNDNYSIKAAELLPTILKILQGNSYSDAENRAMKVLSEWNFMNDADSEGPIYFDTWWRELHGKLWMELDNDNVPLPKPTAFTTIKLINDVVAGKEINATQSLNKDNLSRIVRDAFATSVGSVEGWKNSGKPMKWSNLKGTLVEHLLRLEPLSNYVYNGGNRESVNATTKRTGPSWRMIVSLEKGGVKAWGVYPGGQSGNPGSKLYDNLIPAWETANPYPLAFFATSDAYKQSFKLTTLKPASK